MMNPEAKVLIYDPTTKEVVLSTASALTPNMSRWYMEGVDGPVWLDPHRPCKCNLLSDAKFEGEERRKVQYIERSFREINFMSSYEEWENYFREDYREGEIDLYLHMARCYNDFVAWNHPTTFDQRDAAFYAVLFSFDNDVDVVTREIALNDLGSEELTREQVVQLIELFFNNWPGKAGP